MGAWGLKKELLGVEDFVLQVVKLLGTLWFWKWTEVATKHRHQNLPADGRTFCFQTARIELSLHAFVSCGSACCWKNPTVTGAMWAPRFLLHPTTCTPPCTSAQSDPVSFCLTLTCGTQRALYLAVTCGWHLHRKHIRKSNSPDNQLYESIWSLKEEEEGTGWMHWELPELTSVVSGL